MEEKKVPTGIEGLDKALNGGIPEGNMVLLSGGAGTGKSTICLQYLVKGAAQFNERGLYISTEQSEKELKRQARGFGWDLDALQAKGMIRVMYFDITAGDDFLHQINKVISEFQPKRITIDSMTTLTDALMVSGITERDAFSLVQIAESVSPVPRTEQVIAKAILYKLFLELRKFNVTSLLTSELYEEAHSLSADGISEFICDGVIVLSYTAIGSSVFRNMRIRKMRYTDHEKASLIYELEKLRITVKSVEGGL